MSPTKKKTPAPKKATAKKAATTAKSAKTTKAEKPAAKKPAAKAAPAAAPKKAPAQTPAPTPAARESARKPEKSAKAEKSAKIEKTEKVLAKPASKAAEAAPAAKAGKAVEAKAVSKTEPAGKAKPASGKKPADEVPATSKRAKPRKPVVPSGPRHPKLGFRWSCYGCDAKFYDLGKDEPLCPKCGADQRDRPADEPRPPSSDSARPRVVRPMAQLLDDDEPVAPHVEDDLGLDDAVEPGDMFEGDGDIAHLELDAAELEAETIEAGEPDEF